MYIQLLHQIHKQFILYNYDLQSHKSMKQKGIEQRQKKKSKFKY